MMLHDKSYFLGKFNLITNVGLTEYNQHAHKDYSPRLNLKVVTQNNQNNVNINILS